MKPSSYILAGLLMVLTCGQQALAQEDSTAAKSVIETPASEIPMRLNPQVGVSSFEYSTEGAAHPKFAGGVSAEFGAGIYRAEAGLLFLQKASKASFKGQTDPTLIEQNLLAIPLMAKIRVFASPVQSWSLKLGAIQTYELSSNKGEATNKIDALASLGFSGRLAFTHRADFIIDASYNRGLIPALRAAHDDTYNEGVLVLAGLSFRL